MINFKNVKPHIAEFSVVVKKPSKKAREAAYKEMLKIIRLSNSYETAKN